MSMPATLQDLNDVDEKAELIAGTIVRHEALGESCACAAEEIFMSLRLHARRTGQGIAFMAGQRFVVPPLPSGRQSFEPDVSFYLGQRPVGSVYYIEGAPTFAVEIQHLAAGAMQQAACSARRDDYFAAGAKVVWEVDESDLTVRAYRGQDPANPAIYQRGEYAHAEEAIPGWRMLVDEIFIG